MLEQIITPQKLRLKLNQGYVMLGVLILMAMEILWLRTPDIINSLQLPKLLVSDSHSKIYTIDLSGKIVNIFGEGKFSRAYKIDCVAGKMCIVDFNMKNVKIYDEEGNFEAVLKRKPGYYAGALSCPESIYVDGDGNIIIGDQGNKAMLVYDASYNYAWSYYSPCLSCANVDMDGDIIILEKDELFVLHQCT